MSTFIIFSKSRTSLKFILPSLFLSAFLNQSPIHLGMLLKANVTVNSGWKTRVSFERDTQWDLTSWLRYTAQNTLLLVLYITHLSNWQVLMYITVKLRLYHGSKDLFARICALGKILLQGNSFLTLQIYWFNFEELIFNLAVSHRAMDHRMSIKHFWSHCNKIWYGLSWA